MKQWPLSVRIITPILGFLTIALLLPPSSPWTSEEFRAWNDIAQLAGATANFCVDYGYSPNITENGFCETAESNAHLVRILRGEDEKGNPRGIRYLEIQNARLRKSSYSRGIHPETGAWLDPWGNFYRVRLKSDSAPPVSIPNPYTADEPREIDANCIVWSFGPDGLRGKRNNPHTKESSDDIVSWKKR